MVSLCLAQVDQISAEQAVREMERVNQSAEIPLIRPMVESLRVQFWLAQGDLKHAAYWAEHTSYRQEPFVYSRESAYLALVRVYLAQQRYTQALHLLTDLLSSAEQVMQQALQALLTTKQEAVSPRLSAYAHTVFDAFAGETRQTMTEQNIPLDSTSLPQTLSYDPSPLLEPITPREQQVLRLLAEGATNREIADRLVISLTTVKKHVGNLLLKLAAENRTHAVARARELSLL